MLATRRTKALSAVSPRQDVSTLLLRPTSTHRCREDHHDRASRDNDPTSVGGCYDSLAGLVSVFAPNMSHRNNLTQSGRPMLQICVAQARLELVFFGGGAHSRAKHGNNLARGATGARDLCLVPVCCGVVLRCPSNWGPPRAKDVFEETGLGCNRSRNERISMRLLWRLAKQSSANVKARRSPRRSLNVVGWLSVVNV